MFNYISQILISPYHNISQSFSNFNPTNEQKTTITRLSKQVLYDLSVLGCLFATNKLMENDCLENDSICQERTWTNSAMDSIANIYGLRVGMVAAKLYGCIKNSFSAPYKIGFLPFTTEEEQIIIKTFDSTSDEFHFNYDHLKDFIENEAALKRIFTKLIPFSGICMSSSAWEKTLNDSTYSSIQFLHKIKVPNLRVHFDYFQAGMRYLNYKKETIFELQKKAEKKEVSKEDVLKIYEMQSNVQQNPWLLGLISINANSESNPFLHAFQKISKIDIQELASPLLQLDWEKEWSSFDTHALLLLSMLINFDFQNLSKNLACELISLIPEISEAFLQKLEDCYQSLKNKEADFYPGGFYQHNNSFFISNVEIFQRLRFCLLQKQIFLDLAAKIGNDSPNRQINNEEMSLLTYLVQEKAYHQSLLCLLKNGCEEDFYHSFEKLSNFCKDIPSKFVDFYNKYNQISTFLKRSLDRYADLLVKAQQQYPIPREDKITVYDFVTLKNLGTLSFVLSDCFSDLNLKGIRHPLIDLGFDANRILDSNYQNFRDGDILFYNASRYRRYLKSFKEVPLSISANLEYSLRSKVFGDPHAGLFFFQDKNEDTPSQKNPVKVSITESSLTRKNLSKEHRLYLEPIRLNLDPLFPKTLKTIDRDYLKKEFFRKIRELCIEVDWDLQWRNIQSIEAINKGDLFYFPAWQFKELYHLSSGHTGGTPIDHSQLKLENKQELLCSEFVLIVLIEGINHLNKLIEQNHLCDEKIRHPISLTERMAYLTPKRLHQILKEAGIIDPEPIDCLHEIVDF